MSAIIRDVTPVVQAMLRADTGLATLVTGGAIQPAGRSAEVRIYGERLPPVPIVSSSLPKLLPATIVVASAGGPFMVNLLTDGSPRIELRCYHTRADLARALWYSAVQRLLSGPWFDDTAGVWFEATSATSPVIDTEYGSEFLLARGMVGLYALFH